MKTTIAFDVYGTLIDTNGVIAALQNMDVDAQTFSRTWRDKQLEYSFRRSLMQNYVSFDVCTSQALDYACAFHKVVLSARQKAELLDVYRVLPIFEDVKEGLARTRSAGFRLYAFSNGKADALETLLSNAGIRDLFHGVVSVDDIKTFKPSTGAYCHFLRKADAIGCHSWLVSGNPFDVIGAISAGIKSVWIRRSPEAIFDPWGIHPTLTMSNLLDLADKINEFSL